MLQKFRKGKRRLSGEMRLVGLTLARAQALTGSAKDDPMYELCPVTASLADSLQLYAPEKLDTKRYKYYLERRYVDE